MATDTTFTRDQLERYADVLLWGLRTAREQRFKKYDIILMRYDLLAQPLAEVVYSRILDLGMHAVTRPGLTAAMEHTFYEKATHRHLMFHPPGERELYQHLNGSIFLHAPESLTHLSDIDPAKVAKTAIARKPLRDILDRREEQGLFGWTLCMYPTPELATHARLSIEAYTKQIVKACYLDNDDPVRQWRTIYRKAQRVKEWLNAMDVDHYHVESDSVDLTITPGRKRKWIGISGHNIPSFELFLSPDWRGTEGVYYADQPSYRSGNYVEGIRLTFKQGSVIAMEAAKGAPFAEKQLAMDRGASRVGEFSLTDTRFSRIDRFMANTLFDENFGGRHGNCHLAAGDSYSDTYDGNPADLTKDRKRRLGFNNSALHWDLVNTERKRVTAYLRRGGKVTIYEDGMFML
jgi:aminopeptidase